MFGWHGISILRKCTEILPRSYFSSHSAVIIIIHNDNSEKVPKSLFPEIYLQKQGCGGFFFRSILLT